MKKITLSVLSVLAFGFMNAQSREKGTIEIIPQIGYATANYYGADVTSGNSTLSSVTYGVGGDYFFNDRWSLRSGLLFQTMGTEVLNFREELKYLTLPVNANWHFGSTRKWNLNFGPSIGFLTSAETDGQDIKSLVHSTQIGLNIGIGYKIEVSDEISILLDYQSLSGLSNVSKNAEIRAKNSFGSLNAGVVFKL